jgi:ADP-dependent NAD(P)H-hydrate dehydratase / NAD(P)H-hydrate epimerase
MSEFSGRLPRNLYSAAQVRALDRVAIDKFAIAGFKLMRAAGSVTFDALQERWPQLKHIVVFVGSGNNGGDGYIIAGLAKQQGLNVELVQVGDGAKLAGDARLAFDWAEQVKVPMVSWKDYLNAETGPYPEQQTVLVDALLGTGLSGPVQGPYVAAIDLLNNLDHPVVAVDIPSGLCSDTGKVLGTAVKAELTVTFIGMKQGLLTHLGCGLSGDIIYHDLDVPEEVFAADNGISPSSRRIDINDVSSRFPPRSLSSHKGDHGHVVVVGGDHACGGAVLMAAEAALRAGAGLVTVITRSCHRPAIIARRPEIMVIGTEDEAIDIASSLRAATAIVLGPGLGKSAWSRELLQFGLQVQKANDIPLVIDADGLNLLAERNREGVTVKRDNWILTPHPGEAARLINCKTSEIQADRFAAVRAIQTRWGGCCVLKGNGSLVCYEENGKQSIDLCTEGNPGMATAGMGDVLSGITGSFVAQGLNLSDSLASAVCIHGEAGDLAMSAGGQRGMVATDLFCHIRQLVNPLFQ